MSQEQVEKLLKGDPGLTKEIRLNDGNRYRVRQREQWLAGPCLVLLLRREFVHIAYRNIASIHMVGRGGQGRRQRTA